MKMNVDFLSKRKLNFAFLFLTVLTLLVSCSKSDTPVPAAPREQFVDYTVNGTATSISPAVRGVVLHETDPFYPNAVYIEATNGPNGADLFFRFSDQNISVGSNQELYHIFNGVIGFPTLPATPLQVHITEYGSIGQYISGNFTGTVHDFNPPHTAYLLTCNFRVKRQF